MNNVTPNENKKEIFPFHEPFSVALRDSIINPTKNDDAKKSDSFKLQSGFKFYLLMFIELLRHLVVFHFSHLIFLLHSKAKPTANNSLA
jgi:hypothetical protein